MRVFVAGGTGAVGRALVPQLLGAGHEVVALARSADKAAHVERLGARAVIADALDAAALTAAITTTRPDAIVHQLTSIRGVGSFRKFDQEFALTNRLRTEVTGTMLAAARAAGVRRFIAQSFCGWTYAREGGAIKSETDPLDADPPASFRQTLAAIKYVEDAMAGAADVGGVALRYGFFYGPRTSIAANGAIANLVRGRKLPIIGGGTGVWSFIHVDDAASAAVAALTRGAPGIYNVVDDEPAPVSEWLSALAGALGAPPPRRIPAWVGRVAVGDGGVRIMTINRGVSNAKAKRELGWQPAIPSWRRGFVEALG